MADEELRDFVLAQFDPLEVSVRPLFGGHGFYLDGGFFGFIADGRLYFRTDEESRPPGGSSARPAHRRPQLRGSAPRPRGPRVAPRLGRASGGGTALSVAVLSRGSLSGLDAIEVGRPR